MEDRYDISVDIGEGKDWWYVHGLSTHDKVYGMNKQMCDIGKTMSDPMKPLSEDTGRAVLGCCELLAKDASNAKRMMDDIVRRAEENIRLHNDNNKYARLVRAAYERKYGKPKEKDIMEEKKTKKMTKAEAFEWLKGTKVVLRTEDDQLNLQKKLFDIGYKWLSSGTTLMKLYDVSCVFFLGIDGFIQHEEYEDEANKLFCDTHVYKPIKLHDILSIEIVAKCVKDDEDPYFGGRIKDLQEMLGDEEVLIITKTNFLTMTK